jgi:nucleotide-binding universal stress UspA family protein
MFEKIVVPLDGSQAAEVVLPFLKNIAVKFASDIALVSVSEISAPDVKHLYFSYLEVVRNKIENELLECMPSKDIRIHSEFLPGHPAREILHYSTQHQMDLIIMASKGSSGLSPWILGNIAAKVLRAASQPVLLVRSSSNGNRHEKGSIKKILVPLDGSTRGAMALPYVEALARATQAEIILFRVVVIPDNHAIYSGAYVVIPQPDELKGEAIKYLSGMARPLQESGLKVSGIIGWGVPADAIIEYAKSNDVDLIAMSTHGRTGIGKWVFGSVTDKVLHAGDTPVLVVRSLQQ